MPVHPHQCPPILLVDDDPIYRKSLAEHLVGLGFQVDCAASLLEARKAFAKKPGILILDILLPDGNGAEILREARRQGLAIKCLVITKAVDHMRLLSEMDAFKPDEVFLKPVPNPTVSQWIMDNCLGGRVAPIP